MGKNRSNRKNRQRYRGNPADSADHINPNLRQIRDDKSAERTVIIKWTAVGCEIKGPLHDPLLFNRIMLDAWIAKIEAEGRGSGAGDKDIPGSVLVPDTRLVDATGNILTQGV